MDGKQSRQYNHRRRYTCGLAFLILLLVLLRGHTLNAISDDMLRCEGESVPYWRAVLLFPDHYQSRVYPIDGGTRKVIFITFNKRAFLFVFNGRDNHGCGLYKLPDREP